MGLTKSGDSELIRLTLIDYFSSSILIDSLVHPDVEMQHYNTRYSGVTRKDMNLALRRRDCIMGRDSAREAVWNFVGPNTVVVGHSLHNDLTALRWIHPVVVDTFLIESIKAREEMDKGTKREGELASSPAIPAKMAQSPGENQHARRKRAKGSGELSLKTLAMRRLGREIQAAGKRGHDSLEDAMAARDLANWHIVNGTSIGQPGCENVVKDACPVAESAVEARMDI
jgi:RNA exonuclease 1